MYITKCVNKMYLFSVFFVIIVVSASQDQERSCVSLDDKCDDGTESVSSSSEEYPPGVTPSDVSPVSGTPSQSRGRRQVTGSSSSASCVLPPYPLQGTYVVLEHPKATPGQPFDSFTLTIGCRRGYGLVETNGTGGESGVQTVYCLNGEWSKNMPKCVRFCKLIPDPSVSYWCHVPGAGFKACEGYVPPGARVRPICNSPIYTYSSTDGVRDIHCIDGFWDSTAVQQCKAECGRVTPDGEQLLIGGDRVKRGELPWHAGVYMKIRSLYIQTCGGSLISNNVVISAAHCFWDDNKKKLPASNYAVAIGKIYRHWNKNKDFSAQKSDVKEIRIPRLFQGEASNLQEDIAALILTTPIVYMTYVRPVCVNYDVSFEKVQLQHNRFGKVAGWGLTAANGKPSQILKAIDYPYISDEVCINAFPSSFREYFTADKFCAGYTNGTALCKGDSGGGLAFADKEFGIDRYYLRGVVSATPKEEGKNCSDYTYTTFTKITKHEEFIKEALTASRNRTCPSFLFQCNDGTCKGQGSDCNGIRDCADGSDEADDLCVPNISSTATSVVASTNKTCELYQFQCDDGACQEQGADCNGVQDCADGSDESDKLCNTISNTTKSCQPGTLGCPDKNVIVPGPNIILPIAPTFVINDSAPIPINTSNCSLPEPDHATFNIPNLPNDLKVLTVTCDLGYFIEEDGGYKATDIVYCVDKEWSKSIPKCVRFCKLTPDASISFLCQDRATNSSHNCSEYVAPGTTVSPVCNMADFYTETGQNMNCIDGIWDYEAHCNTGFCNLERDPNIRYMCQDPSSNTLNDCKDIIASGSSVTPICKDGNLTQTGENMNCKAGTWDYIANCNTECGRITPEDNQPAIEDDDAVGAKAYKTARLGDVPWAAFIYMKSIYNLICSGNIISNKIIITDRSCISLFDGNYTVSAFKVAAGKLYGEWNHTGEPHLQISDVKEISIYEKPNSKSTIMPKLGIMTLVTPFFYNSYVKPVCLNLDGDFEKLLGQRARYALWFRKKDTEEIKLKYVDVKVVHLNVCEAAEDQRITYTRTENDELMCVTFPGDKRHKYFYSGAGVVFPQYSGGVERYYLRGILLYPQDCYVNCPTFVETYFTVTRLYEYREYIRKYINM